VALLWTTGGLPAGLGDRIAAQPWVMASTVISGDPAALTEVVDAGGATVTSLSGGWYLPVDVLAVDPASYALATDRNDLVDPLSVPGGAVLGATSSQIRGVGVGARLTVNGGSLVVTDVVDDIAVAGAEIVVSTETGKDIGVRTERAAIVRHELARDQLDIEVMSLVPAGIAARVRTNDETTWLRHADAVLPQSLIKQRFGEFAVRAADGRNLEIDPAWVSQNIVDVDLPIVGRARCHRLAIPAVSQALQRIDDAGMSSVIDPAQFAGCYAPRLIGPGLGVSRHSWGVAIDINATDNPMGAASTQAPELIEAFRAVGFGWGGEWLRPDAMHFEFVLAV
jgi:hypothetical protein